MKNLKIFSIDKTIPKRKLHFFVNELKNDLGFSISSLEINFIRSEEIKKINKDFLNHDFTTDIITFNYSTVDRNIDGEILISVDDAYENAKKYKIDYLEEVGRLVVHGILHLLGFNDIKTSDKKKMKKEENRLIKTYKFILLR